MLHKSSSNSLAVLSVRSQQRRPMARMAVMAVSPEPLLGLGGGLLLPV